MSATKTKTRRTSPQDYLNLVREFPLRPIRSEEELDRAFAMVDRLAFGSELSQPETDYLDVLSDLIEKYEDAQHPIDPLPDDAMRRHLI